MSVPKPQPTKKYTVYTLIDSRNNTPFYVGVTSQSLAQRKSEHIYGARRNRGKNRVKESLILEILANNGTIEIQAIETGIKTIEEADIAESLYIMEYKEKFPQLTNVSAGSDFYRKYSERCDIHSNYFLTSDVECMTPEKTPYYNVIVKQAGEIIAQVKSFSSDVMEAIKEVESEMVKQGRAKYQTVYLSGKNNTTTKHVTTCLCFEAIRL